jgi:signal transduction histidine kinase
MASSERTRQDVVAAARSRAPATAHTDKVPLPTIGAVTVFDETGAIVLQNEAARASFVAAWEGGKEPLNSFIAHLVDRREGDSIWRRALAGTPCSGEVLVHASTSIICVYLEISPSRDRRSGAPLVIAIEHPVDTAVGGDRTADGGIAVVQIEATDLKRRQQELADKTQLLEATLDNMEQGLLVLDAGLNIKAWNDRFLLLLDLPAESMAPGRPVIDIFRIVARRGEYGPGDVEALIAERVERLRHLEPQLRKRSGPAGAVLEQRLVPMPDGGILITYSDVSERQRVEADLRRAKEEAELASRSKTEFLANMSHELRTPLNAIIGFSDVLAGQVFGPVGDKRYHDYARDIHDSGRHLLNLINDVLDVSKVEFGKVELAEEIVEFPVVVNSCVRLMHERAQAAGVAVAIELPADLPAIRADGRRLKQILINLLSNAVKFTPSGGCITLSAAADATGFRMSVSDTGIGIAAEDLATALRPFGQIDSRLARKYQGTGLGLPLIKAMAELHGGGLELTSEPGRGTTATVRLPAERMVPIPQSAASSS